MNCKCIIWLVKQIKPIRKIKHLIDRHMFELIGVNLSAHFLQPCMTYALYLCLFFIYTPDQTSFLFFKAWEIFLRSEMKCNIFWLIPKLKKIENSNNNKIALVKSRIFFSFSEEIDKNILVSRKPFRYELLFQE